MIKDKIIKFLGGYTQKEYLRVERKYQGLLDSKSDESVIKICNEAIYRTLQELDNYAKTKLFGKSSDIWARKMYNVIHNNLLRLNTRYLHSCTVYSIDNTLDEDKQFENILKFEKNYG